MKRIKVSKIFRNFFILITLFSALVFFQLNKNSALSQDTKEVSDECTFNGDCESGVCNDGKCEEVKTGDTTTVENDSTNKDIKKEKYIKFQLIPDTSPTDTCTTNADCGFPCGTCRTPPIGPRYCAPADPAATVYKLPRTTNQNPPRVLTSYQCKPGHTHRIRDGANNVVCDCRCGNLSECNYPDNCVQRTPGDPTRECRSTSLGINAPGTGSRNCGNDSDCQRLIPNAVNPGQGDHINGGVCLAKLNYSALRYCGCLADTQCVSDGVAANNPVKCDLLTRSCIRGICLANSDCAGNANGTTLCNTTTSRCVQCTTDANCAGNDNETRCNTTTGRCVGCTVNSQCTQANRPICNNNRCVQCLTGADCVGGQVCSIANTCTPCINSNECAQLTPSTPICTNTLGSGRCVQCTANQHCAGNANGQVCSAANTCGPCTTDTQCSLTPATPACSNGTCVQCATNQQCAGNANGPICNLTTNTCRTCTSNAECVANIPGTSRCTATPPRRCVQCITSLDCATGTCSNSTNTCVECTANNHCGGTTPICNIANNTCVQCTASSQCTGTTPICNITNNTCVPCASDAQCAQRYQRPRCTQTGSCVQCITNADCAGGTCNSMNLCVVPPSTPPIAPPTGFNGKI